MGIEEGKMVEDVEEGKTMGDGRTVGEGKRWKSGRRGVLLSCVLPCLAGLR